ncbi:MAG: chloride channel protein [Thermosynechococcaceae cyanobacterium MS004]|nr:chloride channel protein [Thermosynechococcaceae cyanobacterium MS004]
MSLAAFPERVRRWLQPQRLTLIEACLIGLISGLAAVLLQQGIGWLGGWRLFWAANAPPILGSSHTPPIVILACIGAAGGFAAGFLIERFAPEASGSGIPQVKAALGQFPVRLNGQVAWVKLISGILALGSGLSLGRQGPTVQIGAALAAQLSYWLPTAPSHRKQMIAAGAGAGLAAGFNAPLTGVLFIVEELLRDLSGLTLGTAILSSFIGAVVARVLGGQSLVANLSQIASQNSFSVTEIPFYILLGSLAGFWGGLFNQGLIRSLDLSQRLLPIGIAWRMSLAGLVSGTLLGLLPPSFQNQAGLRLLVSGGETDWRLAALVFMLQFVLALLAFGSGAPGGVFAPSLVLGASLGKLVGIFQVFLLSAGSPVTYALVGMGAFFGAVSRVPFTGIVIIFEITTDFNLVLPLMISSVVAYWVAEKLSPGSLYSLLLKRQGIELSPTNEPRAQSMLDRLTADDIMQRRVETLSSDLPLQQAIKTFARSHHRGFPVLDQGRLVGILTQTDLTKSTPLSENATIQEVMTAQPVTVSATDTLSAVLYTLNRFEISRLPVVEGKRLVGIITRADIIRAESLEISGASHHLSAFPDPSYGVYQTQSPALGQGRILLPLANPETAAVLLKLAVALARDRNFELECVQIIQIPRNRQPSEIHINTLKSRKLLQKAARYGLRNQVAVHTQIRAAHDVAQAILEVEKQRHIDLILMGWQGHTPASDRFFGNTVDVILRQAASPVLLFKWPAQPQGLTQDTVLKRWLVPISGGPNASHALSLLPPLINAGGADTELTLCQVHTPGQEVSPETSPAPPLVQAYAEILGPRCKGLVKGVELTGDPVEQILAFAEIFNPDVIVLGASRNSLFSQVVQGNIPSAIARLSNRAILLVRAPTMTEGESTL